ncbi:dihydrofolate reductase [Enteropsectra breve]|nr:dihydrofolate reductase [Enteropsectra breve]
MEKIELDKKRLNIITAHTDKTRYIGYQNDLPWKRSLRGDMLFLNKLIRSCEGTALIMGRKTFESMPRKKGMTSIVLSKNREYRPDGAVVFDSLKKAVDYCRSQGLVIVVFGGTAVYEQALKMSCMMWVTIVEENGLQGDTLFPACHFAKKDITERVENYLLSEGTTKTWELSNGSFAENGHLYKFFNGTVN